MAFSRLTFAAAIVVLVAGCANRPIPVLRPVEGQASLESAAHWKTLAAKTAREIIRSVSGQRIPIELTEGDSGQQMVLGLQDARPFFVNPEVATPFGRAFNDLLITQLVRHGAAVATTDKKALIVDYNVQFIAYSGKRDLRTFPGPITLGAMLAATAVGTGFAASSEIIAGATAGSLATVLAADAARNLGTNSDSAEVLITSQVTYGDRYIMRRSDVYYVRLDDFRQYVKLVPPPRPVYSSRKYHLASD